MSDHTHQPVTTVSVILLTYQRPEELQYTLGMLFTLDPPPDEILVLDNDINQSGRQAPYVTDQRVTYHVAPENLGVAAGRNLAARLALGDILVFLDDDAHFAETHIIRIIREQFQDASLACLAFLIRHPETEAILPKEYPGHRTATWQQSHDVSYFLGGACALHRRVFTTLGGFDETFFYDGEELELAFRILREGWRLHYTPTILVYHRAAIAGRRHTGQGQRIYWLIRNRLYVAIKHIPLPYFIGYVSIWFSVTLLMAIKDQCVGEWLRGLRALQQEGILTRATIYRRAHPLPYTVLNYVRQHDGRLWY